MGVHPPLFTSPGQGDISRREERIGQLEAVLAEVSLARDGLRQSVQDHEKALQQLEGELREAREQHRAAQQEVPFL